MAKVYLNFWSRRLRSQPLETMPPVAPIKYQPIDQSVARDVLNLPQDRHLVLMGDASARRQDDALLLSALHHAGQRAGQRSFELVILAPNQPEIVDKLPFKVHFLDLRADLSLALAYSAANLLLVPTLTTALMPIAAAAIAYNTPVVGFNTTGLRDLIDHQQNGYLAEPFEVQDLAQGIIWVQEHGKKLGAADREKVTYLAPPELPANGDRSWLGRVLADCYANTV
jgi:glycosyltransferase involved in cell wall biosynthesis